MHPGEPNDVGMSPDEFFETGNTHDYLSTACYHGLHERCRKECKFCATKCRCPHHEEKQ